MCSLKIFYLIFQKLCEIDIITPILQMRNMGLREVKLYLQKTDYKNRNRIQISLLFNRDSNTDLTLKLRLYYIILPSIYPTLHLPVPP